MTQTLNDYGLSRNNDLVDEITRTWSDQLQLLNPLDALWLTTDMP